MVDEHRQAAIARSGRFSGDNRLASTSSNSPSLTSRARNVSSRADGVNRSRSDAQRHEAQVVGTDAARTRPPPTRSCTRRCRSPATGAGCSCRRPPAQRTSASAAPAVDRPVRATRPCCARRPCAPSGTIRAASCGRAPRHGRARFRPGHGAPAPDATCGSRCPRSRHRAAPRGGPRQVLGRARSSGHDLHDLVAGSAVAVGQFGEHGADAARVRCNEVRDLRDRAHPAPSCDDLGVVLHQLASDHVPAASFHGRTGGRGHCGRGAARR